MMIKRTYLTILSVAIVSVLLGSLFYANLVLAAKPQPYINKDSMDFDLYEGSGFETGHLTFSFSPNREFVKVTGLTIVLVVSSSYTLPLHMTLNDNTTLSVTIIDPHIKAYWWITDSAFYSAISPHVINWIHFHSPNEYDLTIFKVRVSIEYEYQPR